MLWHASFKNIVKIFKIHFGIKSKKRGLFILMQIPENFWTMSPRVLPTACLRTKKRMRFNKQGSSVSECGRLPAD
jgi:hypothetical protein